MINAWQAKQLALNFEDAHSNFKSGLFDAIEQAASEGKYKCTYFTAGEHFDEPFIDNVRSLGYEIYWNSACLWYEVSWER